jgi:hypothetical protein
MLTTNKNFNNINIREFIEYIISYNNIDEILNTCQTQSQKGFIFERLFDIIIKFGFCNLFNNSEYYHLYGNSNNGKLKVLSGNSRFTIWKKIN